MNMRIWLLFWILVLGFFTSVRAQEKCRWVEMEVFSNPMVPDSLSLQEETIRITDRSGKTYNFNYYLSSNTLEVFFENDVKPDSLLVCYQTFSIRFDKPVARRTLLTDYDSTARFKDGRTAELPGFDLGIHRMYL